MEGVEATSRPTAHWERRVSTYCIITRITKHATSSILSHILESSLKCTKSDVCSTSAANLGDHAVSLVNLCSGDSIKLDTSFRKIHFIFLSLPVSQYPDTIPSLHWAYENNLLTLILLSAFFFNTFATAISKSSCPTYWRLSLRAYIPGNQCPCLTYLLFPHGEEIGDEGLRRGER